MDTHRTTITFTKMQGTGNDFVVINNLERLFSKEELVRLAPKLCDRKFGIGSDGLLALFPAEHGEANYTMFYRNPDGSDAGMCGNGARCLALFARNLGFDKNHTFTVHDKLYKASVMDSNTVRISFPVETEVRHVNLDGKKIWQLHTGTEHIVTPVDAERLQQEDLLRQEGEKLRYHPAFQPEGTNVNFICGTGDNEVRLQTYERGVEDLTLACGTGAIAAALVWHELENRPDAEQPFQVKTEGGTLLVYFSFDRRTQTYANLKLEGPAHFVFEGTYFM
ncbi:diaminopimelate epimerase [Fodinibius roseus]|uniref:Diaminopimelate epimerase n=1 Tax=Fodinibius roseus TaxID=1194090 RepID=A0A1M4YEY1_9BACT|nr:diaminopimelate epimerase [Fodinibius roseus]SHF04295.1 diaminopimelate epimerase [Fodinibius roseus]